MRKIVSIILSVILVFSLSACSGESKKTASKLDIKGVFYTNAEASEDGMTDCYVVFDYNSNGKNFELAKETGEVTLAFENNSYEATENKKSTYYHNSETFDEYLFDPIERYMGYQYAVNEQKTIPGSDKADRLFVHFRVNPNDFGDKGSVTLDFIGEKAKFKISDAKEIKTVDEIMNVEADYDSAYQVASFKYRADKAYLEACFITRVAAFFGEDFSGMSKTILNIFNESAAWGVSVSELAGQGFSVVDGIYFDKSLNYDLSPLKLSVVKEAHPDIASLIDKLVTDTTLLGGQIINEESVADDVEATINSIIETYMQICDYFALEMAN
ncbi:MAG: hypothetical protein II998_09800 [Clostridia bacterium]|nr:hypothetical protein [Clostridia bacterium]